MRLYPGLRKEPARGAGEKVNSTEIRRSKDSAEVTEEKERTITFRKIATFNEGTTKDKLAENPERAVLAHEALRERANILLGYGRIRTPRYPCQEIDSTSTIARTTCQTIAEGALLSPKFSPPEKTTRGVHHRPRTPVGGRMSQ